MSLSKTQISSAVVALGADRPTELISRIENRDAHVGVLGLGYVGLPLAVEAAAAGFSVVGLDTNPAKVKELHEGKSYIGDVHDDSLQAVIKSGSFNATTDMASLAECDVIVVAVPTPLTKNLTPDLSFIESAGEMIAPHLRKGQLITLESTTYPGTTEDVLRPILEKGGLTAEKDFFLAHSPERVDPGNKKHKTRNTPKVVGGIGPRSLAMADAFYRAFIDRIVPVSNARTAELVKVYENVFRAVNVGMVNELALLCDRMGLNVWEVLDAAYTKPFGIMPFYPGPGVGGHCIPLDPHYLEHKAKEYHFQTRFISTAGEINRAMPRFVVEKAMRCLNEDAKSLRGANVLVLGVAYKKDIDDYRESPAVEVIRLLLEMGANVRFSDPHVPFIDEHGMTMKGTAYSDELVADSDLVVITTDHTSYDFNRIVSLSKRVLDTRNATRAVVDGREKITLL